MYSLQEFHKPKCKKKMVSKKFIFPVIKGIDDNNKLQKMWSSDWLDNRYDWKENVCNVLLFLVFVFGMFSMFSRCTLNP